MNARVQPLSWQHLACELPAEWEVSRYAVEARSGRLEFVTRHGLRALVSWEPCPREPDRFTTMLGFLRTHVLGARRDLVLKPEAFRTREVGRFLLGWHPAAPQAQALAWLPESCQLVRWLFEEAHVAGELQPWVEPILSSYQPNDGPQRVYRIFGLHLRLPEHFEIERMVVYPANVLIAFEGRDRRRITARRWGLPTHILGGLTLEAFYRTILSGDGAHVESAAPARVGPHEACRLTYAQRPLHQMERYFGRGWTGGEALIWHHREEARIIACEQIGPDRSPALPFADILPAVARTL